MQTTLSRFIFNGKSWKKLKQEGYKKGLIKVVIHSNCQMAKYKYITVETGRVTNFGDKTS